MTQFDPLSTGRLRKMGWSICLLILAPLLCTASSLPRVAKWGRFEQSFKSSSVYTNAIEEVLVSVLFESPLGETTTVPAFWDGGRTWRVRFVPDLAGHWHYRTFCSDTTNPGLDNQRGDFLCTVATGQGLFEQHGPVRVARDHLHFEHADGTPFFWMADTTWNGARVSDPKDWEFYAVTRAAQHFSAVQWSVAGVDSKNESAFTGNGPIIVNTEFFQRLDRKIDTLNQAGLLSVIALFEGAEAQKLASLPQKQVVLLLRYLQARWSGNSIAWLFNCPGGTDNGSPATADNCDWRTVGRIAFDKISHAPAIVVTANIGNYRHEGWVDAFGYQISQNIDEEYKNLPLSRPILEWPSTPIRPVLCVLPPVENATAPRTHSRVTGDQIRQITWFSTLLTPPAGASYAAEGVVNWDTTIGKDKQDLPVWKKSIFLPGAKQMAPVADLFNSIDFWHLRPAPQIVSTGSEPMSPGSHYGAADSENKDAGVVYLSHERTLEVFMNALPTSPTINWINPRTGEKSSAVAVVGSSTCQMPTPEAGDWVLLMKGGKE